MFAEVMGLDGLTLEVRGGREATIRYVAEKGGSRKTQAGTGL